MDSSTVSVRYLIDDVAEALAFYADVLGFEAGLTHLPAFAEVTRGNLRLLLSGAPSSGARATPDELRRPGGSRIHLVVDDLDAERARLEEAGVEPVSAIVEGPGGRQFLVADPSGNLVELFSPAGA